MGTNAGIMYVMNRNRSWTPLSTTPSAPTQTGNTKPSFFQTIASPKPAPTVKNPSVMSVTPTLNRPSPMVRNKTAPAELSALLNSIPSTSSTVLNNFKAAPPKPVGNGVASIQKELTHKDVSRLWSNEDLKLGNITPKSKVRMSGLLEAGALAPTCSSLSPVNTSCSGLESNSGLLCFSIDF